MKASKPWLISLITCAALAACSLQSTPAPSGGSEDLVGQIVQQTFAAFTQAAAQQNAALDQSARQTEMAQAVAETLSALADATPQFTPTPTITPTPGKVRAIVSRETNCRSGPGPAYEVLGILREGQVAEVVGRNYINDTWIIKLPSNPAITCWVWGEYADVSENWEALPIIKTPPTPTPAQVNPG